MLNWLKRKKRVVDLPKPVAEAASSRDAVIAKAMHNMQKTREMIGEDKLDQLAKIILDKQNQRDITSPAAQAKKIIAQMDKDKLGDFMKLMIHENQTRH